MRQNYSGNKRKREESKRKKREEKRLRRLGKNGTDAAVTENPFGNVLPPAGETPIA